ncbi:MAG: hypothetical protein GEV28_26450 [Actinophytocola sp.]|uniref:hypothetical protein n=1 Tax=Actinophytocola sp. TaxID=1872138 RepID=UPI0013230772|nr:hypothetical protein [Actinophytocola sp.]MPZ83741.1 hypothetical protein [Actinophytocola sp.]
MLILGLLLVVVSGAAAVVLIAYNTGGAAETVSAFGRDITDVTMMQAFVAGLVVALVFVLGAWLLVVGGRRGREHRARYRDARREAKATAKERDELADRLRDEDEQRAGQETAAHPVPPAERSAADERTEPMPTAGRPAVTNIHEGQSPTE